MGRRPIDYRRIRDQVRPIQVLRLHGWRPVHQRGDAYHGPCPVHGSHSPASDCLSVEARVWYCHRCHQRGDALALFALYLQLPVYEAALALCEVAGIPVPYIDRR